MKRSDVLGLLGPSRRIAPQADASETAPLSAAAASRRRMLAGSLKAAGALALLTSVGGALATGLAPTPAEALTQGMKRRGERRDTRHEARHTKHECNAHGGKSRSECRQTKRDVKQAGRHD
jgi:hypothetical protein